MSTQQIGSLLRQTLAVLGVIFGVLTAAVPTMHLPTAVSSVLAIGGLIIVAVEHYVSDPSTGSTPPAPPSPTAAPLTHPVTSAGNVGQPGAPVVHA